LVAADERDSESILGKKGCDEEVSDHVLLCDLEYLLAGNLARYLADTSSTKKGAAREHTMKSHAFSRYVSVCQYTDVGVKWR
jgi:hypothetical protein